MFLAVNPFFAIFFTYDVVGALGSEMGACPPFSSLLLYHLCNTCPVSATPRLDRVSPSRRSGDGPASRADRLPLLG